jgi:uncharacterized membrane protein
MDDLLQQGIIAYKAGKRDVARKIFISAVKQSPGNERAWGRLYDVANNDQERIHCLKQILRIKPRNEKAKQLLDAQYVLKGMNSTPESGIESKPVSRTESIIQPKQIASSTLTSSFNSIPERAPESVYQPENVETEKPDPLDLLFALFASFGAALISAFLWYGLVIITGKLIGVAAIAVGWIVAQATMFGARQKRGCLIQLISVFATGFAMLLSEYLIVRYVVVQSLAAKGYTNFPLFMPLDVILNSISLGISKSPLTLLFWGIALWEAFAFSVKRRVK